MKKAENVDQQNISKNDRKRMRTIEIVTEKDVEKDVEKDIENRVDDAMNKVSQKKKKMID